MPRNHTPNIDTANLVNTSEEKRQSLSSPAIRAFVKLCDLWQLNEKERLVLLGSVARSTFYAWAQKASKGAKLTLPLDVLLRISALLGIHKALRIIFTTKDDGIEWLYRSNQGRNFGGQSPKEIMLSGTQDGLMQVRRHLDAWRGGVFAYPSPDFNQPPISTEDIVIV